MTRQKINRIIISRTDSIGDVVLTLPLAHILKQKFPDCKIIFLGRTYTKPVIECCENINEIVCWDEIIPYNKKKKIDFFKSLNIDCIIHVFPDKSIAAISKSAGIPIRIGTSHRLFHWVTCNWLPNFTRKNSSMHEAQLNIKLLAPLGIESGYSLKEIQDFFGFTHLKPLGENIKSKIDTTRYNLILHPKSRGSAQEWGIPNFSELIKILPGNKFKIFVTGTEQEGELVKNIFSENKDVIDLTGELSLPELISFISRCDGLVAASTGPLHLAAVLNKKAIGIYASLRPLHSARWAPIGKNALFLQSEKSCNNCRKGKSCNCLSSVRPQDVANQLLENFK